MKIFQMLAIILISVSMLVVSTASFARTFRDCEGTAHSWTVDEAHALVWEGAPYIPFGIVFVPKYLTSGQTDENWTADEQDVASFKLAGVTDVVVKPGKGMTSVPVEAFQRIIDLLEANELRYGVELYDPEYAPMSGYVIEPTVNRAEGIRSSGQVTRSFPDAKTALYALCDARTGEIESAGREAVMNGEVTVYVAPRTSTNHILLFYPQKAIAGGSEEGGLFDVWSDFDVHRDRLVWYLSRLNFGKGLRFFIDPFTENIGMEGEAESLIPTSPAFRFEYAAWLSKKYGTPRDLNISWGILQHDVGSFEEATRLIPLWRSGRGAAVVYDDGTAKKYPVDAAKSGIWVDFLEFRASSVRAYMDAAADVVKRFAADVPMVYTATGLQPFFQTSGSVGYDGLAVPAAGGEAMVESAGRVLSLAESSSRKMWIISRLKPAGAAYVKKEDLFADINTIRDLGAKGFIVNDVRRSAIEGANLLTWLAEYSSLSGGDKQFASYRPRAIYYPDGIAHASVTRLSNGAWWLPALLKGYSLYLGSSLAGYVVADSKRPGADIHIWSLEGTRTIRLVSSQAVTVTQISGDTTEVKPKKGRVALTVGEEPILVQGIAPDQFLPVEVVAEAMQGLEEAISRAERKKMDASDYKAKLKDAKAMLDKNHLMLALSLVQEARNEINRRMRGLEVMPASSGEQPGG